MAAEPLRERLRKWRPLILLFAVAVSSVNFYVCSERQKAHAEHDAILSYLEHDHKPLQAKVFSLKKALGGLVDSRAPSAKTAVAILDENSLPAMDDVLEKARKIAPAEEAARELHRQYLAVLNEMRSDMAAIREVFAQKDGELGAQRKRAHEIMVGTEEKLDAYYARAVELCRKHKVALEAPKKAEPKKKK